MEDDLGKMREEALDESLSKIKTVREAEKFGEGFALGAIMGYRVLGLSIKNTGEADPGSAMALLMTAMTFRQGMNEAEVAMAEHIDAVKSAIELKDGLNNL